MKVLLVRPKQNKETIGLHNLMHCEPLELEYVSSALEAAGHETRIVDLILERKPVRYFVKQYEPDLVGLTGYITHVNLLKRYACEIKQVRPECKVAVGGVHAEVLPDDFCDEWIDYVIQGNPLKTICQIADLLEEAKRCPLMPADSCHKASDGEIRRLSGVWSPENPSSQKECTFDYPFPDRSKVAHYRERYYYMFHHPCALLKTSFGCTYECNFCFCRLITDGHYYTRDLEDVLAELKMIPERDIYIVDDNFLYDRERILQFTNLLEQENLDKRFLIYGRADFIATHEDVIAAFAQVGLKGVIVGLDSCREIELEKYNKQNSVATNELAVQILRKYNIECYARLLIGLDWTEEDFDNLYNWLRRLEVKFIHLQPLAPLPGTELYQAYAGQYRVAREDYGKWDLAHLVIPPTRLSVWQYYWNIIKLYYKITVDPENIRQLLKTYGLQENLRFTQGILQMTWQYLLLIVKGMERE